ncbi:MAG: uroporphyrinogen-III C-methyltransferase [Oceanococcaceae bacterium]
MTSPAEPSPSPAETPVPAETPAPAVRPSMALGVFLLVLLVLAFANAGVGYLLWNGQADHAQALKELSTEQRDLQQLSAQVLANTEAVDAARSSLSRDVQSSRQEQARTREQVETLTGQMADLTRASQQLRSRVEGGTTAWRLDSVEQLLMTANERLQLAGDARSAERALALADSRLQAIADPAWTVLREQIAEEMASLRGLPEVDVTAISLKLRALANRAENLPLAGHTVRRQSADGPFIGEGAETTVPVEAPWYEQLWGKTQDAVLALVTIRRNTTPTTPLLPPDLHGLLVQNLRLQMEAARTAVLLRDAAMYGSSLSTAGDWIQQYMEAEDPSVRAALQTLDELSGITIQPVLPDISASLRQLRELRSAR